MLDGKKVLVVGAGGLLGSCVSREILHQGGQVVAADLDVGKIEHVFYRHGLDMGPENLRYASVDIEDEDAVAALLAVDERLDGAVNCTYPRKDNYGSDFFQVTLSSFNANVSAHLGSSFLFAQQCARYFKKHRRPFSLVNIASVYGFSAPRFGIYEGVEFTMPVEYAAIKSGVIQLSKYTASYMSDSEFRVNCVSPGGIANGQPERFVSAYASHTFGDGLLSVDDVVGSIVFLLSDKARKINGQNIVVDDGFTL